MAKILSQYLATSESSRVAGALAAEPCGRVPLLPAKSARWSGVPHSSGGIRGSPGSRSHEWCGRPGVGEGHPRCAGRCWRRRACGSGRSPWLGRGRECLRGCRRRSEAPWKDRRLAPHSSSGLAALHGVLSSWPFVLPPAEGVDRAHERVRKRGGTPEQARGERRRLTGTGGAAQALHDGVVREDCLGGEDGLDRFSGAERAQEDDGGGGPAKLALVVASSSCSVGGSAATIVSRWSSGRAGIIGQSHSSVCIINSIVRRCQRDRRHLDAGKTLAHRGATPRGSADHP
jgi:hypothetical protein